MSTPTTLLDDNWLNLAELYEQLASEQQKIFAALTPLKSELTEQLGAKLTADFTAAEAALKQAIAGAGAELATKTEAERVALEAKLEHTLAVMRETVKNFSAETLAAVTAKQGELEQVRQKSMGEVNEKLTELSQQHTKKQLELVRGAAEAARLTTRFKGRYDPATVYNRDDWFTFKGSSYLVLKDGVVNEIPTAQSQRGPDATYAVLAASGAPGNQGPRGQDLVAGGLATLTDAATTAWDLTNPVAKWTLGGNRTLTVSNQTAGATYILHVIQGAGSNTVTWPAAVKWPGNTAPTLTTTAAYRDVFSFVSDGTYLFAAYVQNYNV